MYKFSSSLGTSMIVGTDGLKCSTSPSSASGSTARPRHLHVGATGRLRYHPARDIETNGVPYLLSSLLQKPSVANAEFQLTSPSGRDAPKDEGTSRVSGDRSSTAASPQNRLSSIIFWDVPARSGHKGRTHGTLTALS